MGYKAPPIRIDRCSLKKAPCLEYQACSRHSTVKKKMKSNTPTINTTSVKAKMYLVKVILIDSLYGNIQHS